MDPKGTWHRFILVTPINICQPSVQEELQEGVVQLDLVALPSDTLRTLKVHIAEEFNEREKLVRAKNVALRQEWDQAENKYHKAVAVAAQWKHDEVSLKRVVVELCLELLDMQLKPDTSFLDNVQKVVVRAQELAVTMDTVEAEYNPKIEELEEWDPSE